jgi:DNA polymerase gamma 1
MMFMMCRLGTRISNLGIQLLAPDLWEQVFGKEGRPADEFDERNIDIAIEHLKQQKIWGKPAEPVPNTSLKLPPLEGKSIDEHFQNIGRWYAEPYLSMAKQFANLDEAPPIPKRWHYKSGWTRYASDGTYTEVPHPTEDVFVFDVETLVTESKHAVLACAMSEKAWYSWVSPWLTGESPRSEHLIPLGGGPDADPRLVIGHYISYDRARVKDEYSIRETRTAFLDTMSLHVAVSGLCTQQRSGWVKFSKAIQENDDEYIQQNMPMMKYYDVSSVNSLKEVAKFHCQADIDKSARNIFVDGSLSDVRTSFQDLMIYCALDVLVTQKVYRKVFRMFLEKCPHPISFAGLIQMGRNFLTVNEKWTDYIANSERTYRELSNRIEQKLYELAQAALQEKDPMNDPWLRQLDWTIEPQKFTKPKYKKDGTYAKGGEPRPIARQFMPGYPLWYRDLCDRKTKMPRLTTRTRVAPLLLKLKWNGYPLYYSKLHGWTFRVPKSDNFNTKLKPLRFPPPKPEDIANAKSSEGQVDKLDQLTEFTEKFASGEYVPLKAEEIDMLADAEFEPIPWYDTEANYYRIPHKDGEEARCGNPLAKGYISALEDGILSSEFPLAREALEMNASCSYWISVRERVRSQFVVWEENTPPEIQEKFQQRLDELQNMPSLADKQNGKNDGKVEKFDVPPVRGSFGVNYGLPSRGPGTAYGMILPQIATMGTITRRAVEPTWMTASNAKKNRVGSELKTTVQAGIMDF